MLLLVPADPLSPRRCDEHFRPEAAAAREAGVSVAVVDHDELARRSGDADAAVRGVPESPDAVYRGWMLRSDQYQGMADALARRGVTMRTSGRQYRQAHELPGWYEQLRTMTPESAWTLGADLAAFDACCAKIGVGPAVLRDYVKSLKHYWTEAAFIPDVRNEVGARAVASRFLELRGDDLVGGFVVRRFEHFATTEVRTWWVAGKCALITAHPDTPDAKPQPLEMTTLEPLVAKLMLPFVTIDLVRRADGQSRVVELGDGQVSDRPTTTPAADLIDVITAGSPSTDAPTTTRTPVS